YTSDLSKYVADAKRNTQWRLQYMTVETLERYAYENGLEQGAQQKAVEDARNFYTNGVSIEIIAKSLGMSEEQVKEIVSQPVAAN
nr:hypothetical protein [Treponema sp.]